jgi:hypothetical protein
MKALVLNALGHGFDLDDVDIASPTGREGLVDVQASGLRHTDLATRRSGTRRSIASWSRPSDDARETRRRTMTAVAEKNPAFAAS